VLKFHGPSEANEFRVEEVIAKHEKAINKCTVKFLGCYEQPNACYQSATLN
jgi:hypothetical protein